MEEKKIHGIRVTPATAKSLKVLAAQLGKPMGDVLEALLILSAEGRLADGELAKALRDYHARNYSLHQGGIR